MNLLKWFKRTVVEQLIPEHKILNVFFCDGKHICVEGWRDSAKFFNKVPKVGDTQVFGMTTYTVTKVYMKDTKPTTHIVNCGKFIKRLDGTGYWGSSDYQTDVPFYERIVEMKIGK